MKTKKYIITVEVEVENTSDDAVLAIMDEVNSEYKQLALTHRINEATAKTHKSALMELMYAFNNKIESSIGMRKEGTLIIMLILRLR